MPDDGCASGAASAVDAALASEVNQVREFAVDTIAEGNLSYQDFADAIARDFGERFRPYTRTMWHEAAAIYEKNTNNKVTRHVADYLPDYEHIDNTNPQAVKDAILDAVVRLRDDGGLKAARGGVNVKPMADTAKEASALGVKAWTRDELRALGLSDDVVTQALTDARSFYVQEALRLDQAHAQAEMTATKSGSADDLISASVAKLRQMQAATIADMMTLETLRNATETGRALNQLKLITQALNSGTDSAVEFTRIFGTQNPKQPTSGPLSRETRTEMERIAEEAADKVEARLTKKETPKPRKKREPKETPIGMVIPGVEQVPIPPPVTADSKPAPVKRARPIERIMEAYAQTERAFKPAQDAARAALAEARRRAAIRDSSRLNSSLGLALPDMEVVNAYVDLAKLHIKAMKYAIKTYKANEAAWREFHDSVADPEINDENESRQAWMLAGGRLDSPREIVERLQMQSGIDKESGLIGTGDNEDMSQWFADKDTPVSSRDLVDQMLAKTNPLTPGQTETAAPPVLGTYESGPGTPAYGGAIQKRLDVGITGTPDRTGDQVGTGNAMLGVVEDVGNGLGQIGVGDKGFRLPTAKERVAELPNKNTSQMVPRAPVAGETALLPVATKNPASLDIPKAIGPEVLPVAQRPETQRATVEKLTETGPIGPKRLEAGTGDAELLVDDAGQIRVADKPDGPASKPLFLPEYAKAVQKRLKETYESAANPKRDPHIIPELTELGGYFYSQMAGKGRVQFEEWAMNMHAALGQRIDATDLVNSWQNIKPEAFKRIRMGRDIRAAAIKRAEKTLNVDDMPKFMEKLSAVDANAPDAADQYSDILREFHDATTGKNIAVEALGLWRAIKTSWDLSAPGRQAVFGSLGAGLNPVATVGRVVLNKSNPDFLPEKTRAFLAKEVRAQDSVGRAMVEMIGSSGDKGFALAKHLKLLKTDAKTSREFYRAMDNSIKEMRHYDLIEKFKVPLAKIGGDTVDLSQREEGFMDNLSQEWAKSDNIIKKTLGNGIEHSEMAYAAYLNRYRADKFSELADSFLDLGYTPSVHPELYQAASAYVGDITGRSADFAGMDLSAQVFSKTFFSARNQASRAKINLLPARIVASEISDRTGLQKRFGDKDTLNVGNMHSALRAEATRDILRYAGVYSTLASLAVTAGFSVDLDPRSPDFLKLRRGNTRIDLTGGGAGMVRAFAVIADSFQSLLSGTRDGGRVKIKAGPNTRGFIEPRGHDKTAMVPINQDKFGAKTTYDVLSDFQRQKFAPLPAIGIDIASGKNIVGEPIYFGQKDKKKLAEDVILALLPMQVGDFKGAWENSPKDAGGKAAAIGLTFLTFIGLGASTYDEKKNKAKR